MREDGNQSSAAKQSPVPQAISRLLKNSFFDSLLGAEPA